MRISSEGLSSYNITLEAGEDVSIFQEDGHKLEAVTYDTYIDVREIEHD